MSGTCPILQSTIDPRQAEILESIAVAAQFVREERSFHFRSSSAAAGSGCGFYVFPHPFTYDIHADEERRKEVEAKRARVKTYVMFAKGRGLMNCSILQTSRILCTDG